jgi:hypothetical protein
VIKFIWIGLKIGIYALHLWYELLWKSHEYWIRDTSVLEWILSHMCSSFQHVTVGKMWNLAAIEKSNELKFLWLIDDLVKHISTKFYDHWSCILGVIDCSFKCTESARKVTMFGLINSHLDWKVLKLESWL